MLTADYFCTFAFPWFLYTSNGELLECGDGSLFGLPEEANRLECMDYYEKCEVGWSQCPHGYAVYCREVSLQQMCKLVLPGLKVTGISKVSGKSDTLAIKTTANNIEKYVDTMLKAFGVIDDQFFGIIKTNIHEIRKINTNIYHASYSSQKALEDKDIDVYELISLSKNVAGLSQLLKARTDFLDFLSNPALEKLGRLKVFVYRKFDKVVRGITPTAMRRNIQIRMNGTSHGTIDGLQLFDIAPYLILDNAVKYSPSGQTIYVTFDETDSSISVEVVSLGPLVEDSEKASLFKAGFSGQHAKKTGRAGSGIGLHATDTIVTRLHEGELEFQQSSPEIEVDGIPYCRTTVRLRFSRVG